MSSRKGVRCIALIEAAKGGLVFLAGFGCLELIHRDAQGLAENVVRHFHLNPASRIPRIFVEVLAHTSDSTLQMLAFAAFSYAVLRLTEAWGLWYQRAWAMWLGAVSGAIYIPIELYELMQGVNWIKVSLLLLNTACIAVLARTLCREVLRGKPPVL